MSTSTTTEAAARTGPHPRPLHAWVLPTHPPEPINPALLQHAEKRAAYAQNRIGPHHHLRCS